MEEKIEELSSSVETLTSLVTTLIQRITGMSIVCVCVCVLFYYFIFILFFLTIILCFRSSTAGVAINNNCDNCYNLCSKSRTTTRGSDRPFSTAPPRPTSSARKSPGILNKNAGFIFWAIGGVGEPGNGQVS